MAKLSPALTERLVRLSEMVEGIDHLLPGWNGHHADPPTAAAIEAALFMRITPLSSGGIEVSWGGEEVIVEFDRNGTLSGVAWDRRG